LRNEPQGIFGTRGFNEPYVIIIGNLVLTFFTSKENAEKFKKTDPYMHLNNGTTKEIWNKLPFLTYWDRKQYVSFENAEYEMKNVGLVDVSDVILPNIETFKYNINDIMIDSGDYPSLKGKYPWIVPWSLRNVVPKMAIKNQLNYRELAVGTEYSEEEIKQMISVWLFREQKLTDNLHKFYIEHPLTEIDRYYPELKILNNHSIIISLRP